MNEFIFIIQTIMVVGSALLALRIGQAALITFVAMQAVCANLFVIKQICLCSLDVTASDAYAIGGLLGLNLLQEYYGKANTRHAIVISFFMMLLFALYSLLHMNYIPNVHDQAHEAYCLILGHTPRIVLASLISYLVVQLCDASLYGMFKRLTCGRWYILRNYASITISQLLDTILFSFLGLYGIVHNIGQIILMSYGIKLIIILLATPFLAISRSIKKSPSLFNKD